jgi:hypothetical protein
MITLLLAVSTHAVGPVAAQLGDPRRVRGKILLVTNTSAIPQRSASRQTTVYMRVLIRSLQRFTMRGSRSRGADKQRKLKIPFQVREDAIMSNPRGRRAEGSIGDVAPLSAIREAMLGANAGPVL